MSDVFESVAIVLPSLDPDEKFVGVVDGLVSSGFRHIIIVDDGSDRDHKEPFEYASQFPQCKILVHDVNKGKGRALKDAFLYVSQNFPELEGVITIDGDGQHLIGDIINCGRVMLKNKNKVVLGSRDFNQEGVPVRSVAGNKTTAKLFRLLFGIQINDTQTGLRAIPSQYLADFSQILGERFEYETNMLLQMKRSKIDFIEEKIETVYDPDDYSSHYDGFKDSMKIAKVMLSFLLTGSGFKYAVSAVLSVLADNGLFYLLTVLFGVGKQLVLQPISTFLSSVLNFHLNKYWVFQSKGNYRKELLQYYAIFLPRTLVSVLLTHFFLQSLAVTASGLATAVKMIVDFVLFVIVYFLQKKWVFK